MVKTFADFNDDDNPYGERDYGYIDVYGDKVYWKIDYYDENYEYGSENPADPACTRRVLIIMLASEY